MKLLPERNIKIKGQDYLLKMTVRALMNYEKLTNHSANIISGLNDSMTLFYCAFRAGGSNLDYEQFLDLIDDEPESVKQFTEWAMVVDEKKKVAR